MKEIEIYTNVLDNDEYGFGFMPGTNRLKKTEKVNRLTNIVLKTCKEILNFYNNIIDKKIEEIIVSNPCTY